MKYIIINVLIGLIILSCSTSKEAVVMKEFTGDGVAVINFSVQGSSISTGIGKNAADRLTDALFLKKNLRVIDRSKVNDALVDMEIKTSEALSKEQLANIGQRLNANYLILGRIVQSSDSDFLASDNKMGLYITFRIVATSNSDIVGMATYKTDYKDDLFKEIDIAMNQLAEELK